MADIVNNIWIFRLIELTPVLCHRDATRRPTKKAQSKLLLIGPGMFSKAECQVPATKGGQSLSGANAKRPARVRQPAVRGRRTRRPNTSSYSSQHGVGHIGAIGMDYQSQTSDSKARFGVPTRRKRADVGQVVRSNGKNIMNMHKNAASPQKQYPKKYETGESKRGGVKQWKLKYQRPSTTSKVQAGRYRRRRMPPSSPVHLSAPSEPKYSLPSSGKERSANKKNMPLRITSVNDADNETKQPAKHENGISLMNRPKDLVCGHVSGAVSVQGFKPNKPGWLNQDNVLELRDFNGRGLLSLVCVFDGHGKLGREVSEYCVQHLTSHMLGADVNLPFTPMVRQKITQAFLRLDDQLRLMIDTSNSGSTAVAAVLSHNSVLLAHVGDSRACVGRIIPAGGKSKNSRVEVMALTADHKPNRPDESQRVHNCGGRVSASPHYAVNAENATQRVWSAMPNIYGPGLAVSRSFGDAMAHTCGVTTIPEVRLYKLQPHDKWMCMATDGVWDVMSLNDVAAIVNRIIDRDPKKWNPKQAARMIVATARKRWRASPQANGRIDDITALVVKLKA